MHGVIAENGARKEGWASNNAKINRLIKAYFLSAFIYCSILMVRKRIEYTASSPKYNFDLSIFISPLLHHSLLLGAACIKYNNVICVAGVCFHVKQLN